MSRRMKIKPLTEAERREEALEALQRALGQAAQHGQDDSEDFGPPAASPPRHAEAFARERNADRFEVRAAPKVQLKP